MLDAALTDALRTFAARPRVVIGVDFDGTLAPLVDDPMHAAAVPGSLDLVARLAEQPGVTAAVVSGRALRTLGTLTGADHPVVLIGSHGAESSLTRDLELDGDAAQRLAELDRALAPVLAEHPEVAMERKPTSRVLHTRRVDRETAATVLAAGEEAAAELAGLSITPGKDVLEFAVTSAAKGPALLELAAAHDAEAVLYVGDDVTDERAFAVLREEDVTIKVGAGDTAARHRVADEHAVVEVLTELLRLRSGDGGDQEDAGA